MMSEVEMGFVTCRARNLSPCTISFQPIPYLIGLSLLDILLQSHKDCQSPSSSFCSPQSLTVILEKPSERNAVNLLKEKYK